MRCYALPALLQSMLHCSSRLLGQLLLTRARNLVRTKRNSTITPATPIATGMRSISRRNPRMEAFRSEQRPSAAMASTASANIIQAHVRDTAVSSDGCVKDALDHDRAKYGQA